MSVRAIAIALALLGFVVLGVLLRMIRGLRSRFIQEAASSVGEGDVEKQDDKWLVPSPSIPMAFSTVAPPPGVRWEPQVRSISGPEPVRDVVGESKSKSLPPKRSRSPPLCSLSKSHQDHTVDPRPKSAPPAPPGMLKGLSPPSSCHSHTLSVSGRQVRGLEVTEKGLFMVPIMLDRG